jgi:hypothetical protein
MVIQGVFIAIKGGIYRDEGRQSKPERGRGAELSRSRARDIHAALRPPLGAFATVLVAEQATSHKDAYGK